MQQEQYATSYETSTTTKSTTMEVPGIGCNVPYLVSIPGVVKMVALVAGLLTVILAGVYDYGGRWFCVLVPTIGLFVTSILFIFYLTNFIYRLSFPAVPIAFFIGHAVFTGLYLIVFIVLAVLGNQAGAIAAAAAFSFLTTAAYAFDTFLYFKAWRENTLVLMWMPNASSATTTHTTQSSASAPSAEARY